MNYYKTGEFIKKKREFKGLTQAALAEELGVEDYDVNAWECGDSFPKTELLLPLSKILDFFVEDMLKAGSETEEKEELSLYGGENQEAEALNSPDKSRNIETNDNKSNNNKFENGSYCSKSKNFEKRLSGFEIFLGYVLSTLILLMVMTSGLKYIGRERNINIDNYKNYIHVNYSSSIYYTYELKADTHITDLSVNVTYNFERLYFYNNGSKTNYETVTFTSPNMNKNSVIKIEANINLQDHWRLVSFTVNSVSGGLD